VHWNIKLPNTIEELFIIIGSRQRHELFRKERRIKNKFENNINFHCYKNENEISILCKDLEKISKNSLQGLLGYGFINNSENKNFLSILAKRCWLRAYLLYIDKLPCAFYICHFYKEQFFFRASGFDLRYKNYSPGFVLLKYILEDVYNFDEKVEEIDWGKGDEIFMRHLGYFSTEVGSIYIFPHTIYGFILNFTRGSLIFIKTFIKSILTKFGLKETISRYWRQHQINKQYRYDYQKGSMLNNNKDSNFI
jgi:hypothetical protein